MRDLEAKRIRLEEERRNVEEERRNVGVRYDLLKKKYYGKK